MENQNKPASGKPAEKTAAKPTKKPAEKSSGGGKGIIILLVILVLALGGLTGYLFNQNSELESELDAQVSKTEEKESEIENLTADIEQKIAEFIALEAEYTQMGEINEELQAQREELESQLATWKKKANSNAYSKKQLKKEVEKIKAQAQLDLIAMEEELSMVKLLADSLKTENDSLQVIHGQAVEENASLTDLVKLASVLETENLTVTAINSKNKEYDGGEYKASRVEKIRVKFNLADNKVAKKDGKEMILRIIEPSGTVLFDLSSGGGSFTNAKGKTDFYTDKQALTFDNSKQTVTFIYNKGSEYEKGTYNVEIYGEGYLIGETSFVVK